ncbi:MAG: motif [Gemmatimonadetes bacterium]|nr:motif [Gemmatimonadota bacterium]
MLPGRNDPCPCGSGKKYKKCCAGHDAGASPLLRVVGKGTRSQMETIAAEAISSSVAWEADVTPMPMSIDSDPSGRPAAVILAANAVVLHMELEAHPPSDARGVAMLLAKAIETVLARGGAPPTEVLIRHPAVAVELRQLLGEETTVLDVLYLATLHDFAEAFRQQMSGMPLPPISHPQMWAAWDLPADTLTQLFSAAAAYYSAAPWLLYGDDAPLQLDMPNGSSWYAVVLGFEEQEIGLVLYESLDDYLTLVEAPSSEEGFSRTEKIVLSLSFDARAELPKPMRREFTDAKWRVAGPSAYPSVWTLNTIGGGLSNEQAIDLTMALDVIARLGTLSEADDVLIEGLAPIWTDETSGTMVRWAPDDTPLSIWEIPQQLMSSLAEGQRADPEKAFAYNQDEGVEDAAIVARFAVMHSGDASDVDLFVQLMHDEQGVRLPALTELDLRTFLYDLLPRKTMTTKEHGNSIRASLQRFFDYLATHDELRYPWASAILSDHLSFEDRWDTFPGGRQQGEALGDWMSELFEDFDMRVMIPSNELAGVGTWGETQGVAEASLYSALQREWLIWRDAEIALGNDTPKELWDRLIVRQAEWEKAPHPQLGGKSPSEEIAAERGSRKRAKARPGRRR